jgi:hypothetical protein
MAGPISTLTIGFNRSAAVDGWIDLGLDAMNCYEFGGVLLGWVSVGRDATFCYQATEQDTSCY